MSVLESEVVALVAVMAPEGESRLDACFFDDLGYTSLRFLELTIAVERAFGLPPLTPESLAGIRTVGDLVDLVRMLRESHHHE